MATALGQPWAKSPDTEGRWLTLSQHMQDSAAVGGWLIENWLAPGTLACGTDNGLSSECLRKVGIFLAGAHDVGKSTPAFAAQSAILYAAMGQGGLTGNASVTGRQCHHTRTGFHLLLTFLQQKGLDRLSATTWAVVVAGHHGVVPSATELRQSLPTRYPDFYGWEPSARAAVWKARTTELLDEVWSMAGLDAEDVSTWPALALGAQVTLVGLVIMADWIASNTALFPLGPAHPGRVESGVTALRLPRPWRPQEAPESAEALFASRFDLFAGARPRPFQVSSVDAARWLPEHGLLLLEAAPGEGKTEAALAAAEVLAQRFALGGAFVALPTQATTDAMFGRVISWLEHMGEDELPVGSTAWLGHSRRRLNRVYQGLPTVRLSEIHDEDACLQSRVAAHEWLTRKKALLATTVVATIDQLLLASLTLKHGALRFLGLATKVLIIDEVHAYDPFMRTHLVSLLQWLAELRVPVVMLSATLPSGIRQELVEAYAGPTPTVDPETSEKDAPYPRVTAAFRGGIRTWAPAPSGRASLVALQRITDDDDVIALRLEELLADGGCALVVRNTVKAARRTAEALRRRLPMQVECHHARFLAGDRQSNDERLLSQFGHPDLVAERGSIRPTRAVVVATQVAEISLDVDFDVLLTDLAPMDAIVQRIGRCHRHQRPRPHGLADARCIVITDLAVDAPPRLSRGSVAVYGMALLLATAAQLEPRFGNSLRLPDDIVPLVEGSYAVDPTLPEPWLEAHRTARIKQDEVEDRRRATARSMELLSPKDLGVGDEPPSLIGWLSRGGVVDGDENDPMVRGEVRDGRPSVEFILLESDDAGAWTIPTRFGAGVGQLDRLRPPSEDEADAMASCLIRLTPPGNLQAHLVLQELVTMTPEAWRELPLLGRVPVVALDPLGVVTVGGITVRYDALQGMELQW